MNHKFNHFFSHNFNCHLIEFILSNDLENELVNLFDNKDISIIIRGNLEASKLISLIKNKFNLPAVYRIACLLKENNHILLIAPVGIDEGKTINEKIVLINYGIKLLKKMKLKPKIAILKKEKHLISLFFMKIIKYIKNQNNTQIKKYSNKDIKNAYKYSNYILFQNGITGNLIFRTLSHICNFDGYGAPMYFCGIKKMNKLFIDTSRSLNHYVNAIKFAAFLMKK